MTPPFNIVVARPQHDAALVFAARELRATRGDVPGVVGALPEVDLFARAWTDAPRLRMAHGVYAARHVRAPADVEGSMRLASLGDLDQIVEWLRAFAAEALPDDAPHLDAREAARRRLQSDVGGTALWELDGEAVSMCGFGGPTPRGIRIGPVYTPPELRGRGYGSAVTAAASQSQLDAGREYCFLFTDLANATSNKIYVDIGYELVCEAADYAFENRGAGV
jgi:predicted GNAT family acetyltransferase